MGVEEVKVEADWSGSADEEEGIPAEEVIDMLERSVNVSV